MSKLLVVFGATGNQGGSVIASVLNDPVLSKEYKIRAITRDPSKPAAETLQQQKGVEVVKGDADDKASLKPSLQGAHTVFSVTASVYDDKLYEREIAQGKAIADAAIATGAQYIIYSTLPSIEKFSGGKFKNGAHFNVKYDVEQYIRTLPIKSAFFAPGSFDQNFAHAMGPRPSPANDGTYAIANFVSPSTQLPLIDIARDAGKFVGAILAEPAKYEGKVFSAATALYSYTEIAETMSRVSGKTIKYNQLPQHVYSGFLPPTIAPYLTDMFLWIQDFGYYGPKSKEEVEWAAKNARGKLTTLEEYLKQDPLHLE